MGRDEIYRREVELVPDFAFDDQTALVFEDMLARSVPFYNEIQRQLVELAGDFAVDGSAIFDLGCSHGATLEALDAIPQDVTLVGLDSSLAMLTRADARLSGRIRHRYELREANLNDGPQVVDASVVVMSLTLQFVRPPYRARVLSAIHDGLQRGGCLLLVEKVGTEESLLNRLYIAHYHQFKERNGYSGLEIARKREALENVLIPYRINENEALLRQAGFRAVDVFFKWYNFAGLIALK